MVSSHRIVVLIAAAVWYGGGVSLVVKGGHLVRSAIDVSGSAYVPLLAASLGIGLGLVKARFIFLRSCRKNLRRIASLPDPRPWQCFRPGFLVFLAMIIPTGVWMSGAAAGDHAWLCIVAALDLSIATALLVSSIAFWQNGGYELPG